MVAETGEAAIYHMQHTHNNAILGPESHASSQEHKLGHKTRCDMLAHSVRLKSRAQILGVWATAAPDPALWIERTDETVALGPPLSALSTPG